MEYNQHQPRRAAICNHATNRAKLLISVNIGESQKTNSKQAKLPMFYR
jgi:hypothetical protein